MTNVGRARLHGIVAGLVVLCATAALAQRGFGRFGRADRFAAEPNAPYDGRFQFVRVKYETGPGGFWWRGLPSWAHGYPTAERNLMRIMDEVSFLNAHIEINTVALDD